MKKLPIGIQTFAKIIKGDFVYIDKTPMIAKLLDGSGRYFLSRPRRFGKSLLVDTLKELFEGNQSLFQGLYIENKWDWNQHFPVIKIDFTRGGIQQKSQLDEDLHLQLDQNQQILNLNIEHHSDPAIRFTRLIQAAVEHYQQQVVILIDEYDKPILDNIERLDVAAEVREALKSFYSVMKNQDAYIRFIFMTGVSKFSKVSLFSGLNQLEDITLDSDYSTLCGYTEQDLQGTFAKHLQGADWQKLKLWYNGYHFDGDTVYNPYDILLFISKGHRFRSYWFETGSPSFLLKLFKQQQYFLPQLEQLEVGEEILDSFDIERIDPITLLFQTGYLTLDEICETDFGDLSYRLKVPNQEVRSALNTHFIQAYGELDSSTMQWRKDIFQVLNTGDLEGLEKQITRLFAAIPWRNFTHNDLPEFEGYYASVLYAFFASMNAIVIPEDISLRGQADMTVIVGDYIYVMEFKRDTSTDYQALQPNPALEQIQQQQYAAKYQSSGKTVFQVGMIFNTQVRNLVQMDWL